jgi:hypothetical protein
MSNLAKSVKVVGQVVGLLLGENFQTPLETVMTNHPNAEYLYK